jgi:DNA-directed RNA polymerase subunit K/omega
MAIFLPITKYEQARIIGTRASQIANGSKPLTDVTGLLDPLEMASKEFYEGVIPIIIVRNYNSNKKSCLLKIVPSSHN